MAAMSGVIVATEHICVDVPLTPHQASILPATHRQVHSPPRGRSARTLVWVASTAMLMAKSTFSATSQCLGFAADLFVLACKPVDAASKLKWFHRVPVMWARDPARWARDGLPGITGADFQ